MDHQRSGEAPGLGHSFRPVPFIPADVSRLLARFTDGVKVSNILFHTSLIRFVFKEGVCLYGPIFIDCATQLQFRDESDTVTGSLCAAVWTFTTPIPCET